MSVSHRTDVDVERAKQVWAEYQRQHDVSDRKGQAVGIDPESGRVWFGESASAIWLALESQGTARPLFYTRVGRDSYQRKGGRR
jgi:hypothetical protein